MKWWLLALGIPVIVVLVLLIIGLLQPTKHSVTRFIHLKQKPETIFPVLEKVEDLPNWSTTILKVERLPDINGRPTARFTLRWGHLQMIMTQLERMPPTRLVSSMAREDGPVLGTWTYEITPENNGCRIGLTENGEVTNPFYRVMGRLRGLDANIKQSLHDLARRFGENAEVQIN